MSDYQDGGNHNVAIGVLLLRGPHVCWKTSTIAIWLSLYLVPKMVRIFGIRFTKLSYKAFHCCRLVPYTNHSILQDLKNRDLSVLLDIEKVCFSFQMKI